MHEAVRVCSIDLGITEGNVSALYHRNEFELSLKLLVTETDDHRSNYWGKFENHDICEMTDCENAFSVFLWKHHCYICGKVICDGCGKNKFVNPITGLEQVW